jgi:hypothetical protein
VNDYLGTSHEAIYNMVQKGEPGQSNRWATDVSGIGRDLGTQIASLREQCALIETAWSDGVGSVRLTADLGAVIDYLQVLADGLSGQSASYSNLTVQAAADLAAAQPPSALPPPPVATPTLDLSASIQQINGSPVDLAVAQQQVAELERVKAANHAAWLKAGETATTLDNEYRTAIARLTPPPEPPSIVLDAATADGAVDPRAATESAAGVGVSAGGSGQHPATGGSVSGWSVDRYLPAGTSGGSVGQAVPSGTSVNPGQPLGSAAVGSAAAGSGAAGSAGSGVVPADLTGANNAAAWTGGGLMSAGTLSGGTSALGLSRPRVDPANLHGGIWDGSGAAGAAGLGTGGSAAGRLANGSLVGSGTAPDGTGFDPVTGSAISAGSGRFDAAPVGAGSGWETAAGVGGIAALVAGAVALSRGGAGAVTAAGLSGGFGAGPGGAGPSTGGVSGSGAGSGAGGVTGPGVGGPGATGNGTGYAGGANTAAGAARGFGAGLPGTGSNSMVRGGQIGQSGRGVSGAAGAAAGRPGAPGSGIGGEHGYRVTWLVEDRDLYGRGPSVKPVIDAPPDVD